MGKFGQIVILNGAPRSGKSSIATEILGNFVGNWVSLGVDNTMQAMPDSLRPGIGLRPGGERPELEEYIVSSYGELYKTIRVQSLLGINVVVDVGHHDNYSKPLGILPRCLNILKGLPVMLVGVRCALPEILARRALTPSDYLSSQDGQPVPAPILLWQKAVHVPGVYDLEVETSTATPAECADSIAAFLNGNTLSAAAATIMAAK
ncbi:MAG: phosphotransferase [Rhodobacteraceae bacterium]|nr:phosphotransferase [Paracoccaceae bacterium]